MASSFLLFLFLFCLSLIEQPPLSAADLQKTSSLFRTQLISEPNSLDTSPTTFFEVTKPILLPKTKPCSYLALQYDFAYTYGKPPVFAEYRPPSNCPSKNFSKIVLEWTATCKGRQYDRIFSVWLGGVEILRSCTAEPTPTGIVWTVKKDITRYYSLLMSNQTLAVYLRNIIDSTYTGVYHVDVTFHFYPSEEDCVHNQVDSGDLNEGSGSRADLILPISRNLQLTDGFWFEIKNSTDSESKEFKIPQNVYRAVLEVYVSFHEKDEFWFGNFPNEYISANNLTGAAGNGPFREVVVSLDNLVVGAVWPFTVIYTGGVNPLLWRPITGIGSFDLPSYDIEITPFLGKMLGGKAHKFTFGVTNALNVWYIDANLHLWLDKKSEKTRGKLLEHDSLPLSFSLQSKFTGFDGSFVAHASRSIISSGWVKSSRGVITTKSLQGFKYSNKMVLGNHAHLQILKQTIHFNGRVDTKMPSSSVRSSTVSFKKFGVHLSSDDVDKGNGTYASIANLTLSIKDKEKITSEFGSSTSRLKNLQNAQGFILVKGNQYSGLGSTQHDFSYIDDNSCYFRDVSSSNYTILHDKQSNACQYHKRSPFSTQKEFFNPSLKGQRKG